MILVTGGAGYIGSHMCAALANAGLRFVIADNFCNSDPGVAANLERLIGFEPTIRCGDIRDRPFLNAVFDEFPIRAVIHFAGLKSVAESVRDPVTYFSNNVAGSVAVIEAMKRVDCKTLVFSSSATVYGDSRSVPIPEDAPSQVTNPYGRSKLIVEQMLDDVGRSDPGWRIARLRYFNPAGAHESGLIGEAPNGVPNNLMPYVVQVASGERPALHVFGNDYATPDGTGVRDYIHVMDLAEGHLAALEHLRRGARSLVLNLGTGHGTSVLQMVASLERASGRKIACEFSGRRAGDVAASYADPGLAERTLSWTARRNIDQICQDAWRWHLHSRESTVAESAGSFSMA